MVSRLVNFFFLVIIFPFWELFLLSFHIGITYSIQQFSWNKGKVRSINEIFLSTFVLCFSFLFSFHFLAHEVNFSSPLFAMTLGHFHLIIILYVILYFIFFGKFSRFYYLLNTFQSNKNKKKTKAKLKPRPFLHCWVLQSCNSTAEFQPFKHFSTNGMTGPKSQL